MSVAAEVGITVARELRRNLRGAKGISAALLYLLGGAVALLLYVNLNSEFATEVPEPARVEVRRRVFEAIYHDAPTVEFLAHAPTLLFFLYGATLIFLPLLCMLIGYDQISGDLQYRTIRFATGRARRESLVVGQALGVWASTSILAFALHLLAWVITIARGDASVGETLAYGLRFWFAGVLFASGYVGLTMLLSSASRTPILTLLSTLGAATSWWLLRHIARSDALDSSVGWLAYLAPGEWEPKLLSPDVARFGIGAAVLLAFGVVLTAGACLVMRSRDV